MKPNMQFASNEMKMLCESFRDYWNQYRVENHLTKKALEYSTVTPAGKPISFSEKEAALNSALKREVLRASGVTLGDYSLEAISSNPNVVWATFAIVSQMIDMILPETMIDTIGLYTDVRTIGWGDSAAFDITPRDLFVVSRAGRAQRTTEMHKQFNGQVTVLPEMREISVMVSLYKVLAGTESLAEFTMKAVRSIESQVTVDVYNAFQTAIVALPTTGWDSLTTSGLKVSGYTQDDLVAIAQRVTAWNNGAKPVIVGTQRALVNVLPDDANYRYTFDDQFVTIGYLRTAFGYDTMVLPQVADWTNPFSVVLSDAYIYLLSPSSQKIVKLVLEGATLSNTTAPFQFANLTQATSLFKSYGTGVAVNAVAGIITL